MAYLKTSNNILVKEVTNHVKIVQCPYCKTYIKGVSAYITAMTCWHCDREFRIQQDVTKYNSEYNKPGTMKRTALGRVGQKH